MADIIYLVRTKVNTHGDLVPIKYENCPCFIDKKERNICNSGEDFCCGIIGENIMKDLGDMNYLLECKYYCR